MAASGTADVSTSALDFTGDAVDGERSRFDGTRIEHVEAVAITVARPCRKRGWEAVAIPPSNEGFVAVAPVVPVNDTEIGLSATDAIVGGFAVIVRLHCDG